MAGLDLQLDVVSYSLLALVVSLVFLPLFLSEDADIHPFALLRQSTPSPVRQPGESAIYRSLQTPHGFPLVAGLQLPAEQRYTSRHGDIRDLWKLALEKGNGKMLSIKGVDTDTLDMQKLNSDIHAVGKYLSSIPGVEKVALYLPNDVENLVATFACAFYGLTLILLPFDPETTSEDTAGPTINSLLRKSAPDVVISQAGQFPLTHLEGVKLKEMVSVVEVASRHLDWSSPPHDSFCKISQYHLIIDRDSSTAPAPSEVDLSKPAVCVFDNKGNLIPFAHHNIIAAVAAQSAFLPKSERFTEKDTFIPVSPLSDLFTRILLYTALAAGTTIALNPIASSKADLQTAVKNVSPTVIVASPASLLRAHSRTKANMMELWHNLIHWFQRRTLESGRIPRGNFLTKVNDYERPSLGPNVRLVFTAEDAVGPSTPLSERELADLRIFLGSKVVYGLTHPLVAGCLSQWNVYDYRADEKKGLVGRGEKRVAHFGGVMPGCEVKLVESGELKAADVDGPKGEVVVAGTVVSGDQQRLGVNGRFADGGLLAYA